LTHDLVPLSGVSTVLNWESPPDGNHGLYDELYTHPSMRQHLSQIRSEAAVRCFLMWFTISGVDGSRYLHLYSAFHHRCLGDPDPGCLGSGSKSPSELREVRNISMNSTYGELPFRLLNTDYVHWIQSMISLSGSTWDKPELIQPS
jgi:hypothetical protein